MAVFAVPALIAIATLLARRFGHSVAGLVAGLPLTSGPLSLALALGHGRGYAAHAAIGSNVGIFAATIAYGFYALTVHRMDWRVAMVCTPLAFGAITVVLVRLPWTLGASTAAAVGSAALVGLLFARRAPAAAPLVDLDLVPRVVAGLAVVTAIATLTRVAGPVLVGALTPLPVVVGILTVFAQRRLGSDAALLVVRGAARGTYGFAAFFLVVGLTVEHLPLAGVYALAVCATLTTVALTSATVAAASRHADRHLLRSRA